MLFHGRSLHGVGFDRIEDHGVTLLTVASRRGDLVSIKYISSFLRISEIYITHKKQESGELFYMKSWLFFFFHSQVFPWILEVFQSATGILWIVVSCTKNRFVNVCFVFLFIWFFLFRFVSVVSCFASFRFSFILFRFCCVSFVSFRFCFVSWFTITLFFSSLNFKE